MKKIHRQPGPSTSGPPISHAVVAPMPPSAPQIPSALFRSEPSVKVVEVRTIPSSTSEVVSLGLPEPLMMQTPQRPKLGVLPAAWHERMGSERCANAAVHTFSHA